MNEPTFAKLAADACAAPASAGGAKVVSLFHLLALKCHAIKHGNKGRIVKDADDVIQLVQVNRLDIKRVPTFGKSFRNSERQNCMKRFNESTPEIEIGDLELPDWSGMNDSSQRVSPDAAFLLCEQYAQWFPEQAKRWLAHRPEKCCVEFKL